MEEQIDVLNLDKLEVKMKKGRQVHFFVCGDPESYEESDGNTGGNRDKTGKCGENPLFPY